MKVAIIGAGYVGLTTGAALAHIGSEVTCIDVDATKIDMLNKGKVPIYEPGLAEVLRASTSRICYTTEGHSALGEADVIVIAVGTPANRDGSANLDYLFKAVDTVIRAIRARENPTVLVNKSTAPVGSVDKIRDFVHRAGLDARIGVVSSPEFLRQGRALQDTLYPNRLVFGGDCSSIEILSELYKPIISQSFAAPFLVPRPEGMESIPVFRVDARSAELAKYAANAFLAMKISFINDIANISDVTGANVLHVADIVGSDKRIGRDFLNAGIGYGGSCFPKDTQALLHIGRLGGYNSDLLEAVIDLNRRQRTRVVDKLRDAMGSLMSRQIAMLGLTFKPGTDDLRDAPSLDIMSALIAEGALVRAHDPIISRKLGEAILPKGVKLLGSISETLQGADALVLVTEWPEYMQITAEDLTGLMQRCLVIDGRNSLGGLRNQPAVEYYGIGI